MSFKKEKSTEIAGESKRRKRDRRIIIKGIKKLKEELNTIQNRTKGKLRKKRKEIKRIKENIRKREEKWKKKKIKKVIESLERMVNKMGKKERKSIITEERVEGR